MKIETKYDIGEHIIYTYIYKEEVYVFDDYITEIAVNENNIFYYGKYAEESMKEEDIILYSDRESLSEKITNLLQQISQQSEENI